MVGQQIGSYKIERKLGQGGFGIVYVGVDVRLNRRAAIKQLLPELSGNREIVERFFNEAKAAASINHLGIVEIYDVGWHTDGSAYVAMKLLDGDSLAKRIHAGPMPISIHRLVSPRPATRSRSARDEDAREDARGSPPADVTAGCGAEAIHGGNRVGRTLHPAIGPVLV
ncbi:MAG: protein kinase [Deltaproteobacteria bacterium]|nr:protein kinase [Deltaproteobacteria bacterium]